MQRGGHSGRSLRPRFARKIAVRLIALVLVPTIGLVMFASDQTIGRRVNAQYADRVGTQLGDLSDLIQLRFLLSKEEIPTLAALLGPKFGISVEQAGQILGMDLTTEVRSGRGLVDTLLAKHLDDPDFRYVAGKLSDVRRATDGHDASIDVYQLYDDMLSRLDDSATQHAYNTWATIPPNLNVAQLRASVDQLLLVHQATNAASSEFPELISVAVPGVLTPDKDPKTVLLESRAVYRNITALFGTRLTGAAHAGWVTLLRDPSASAFELAIDDTIAGTAPGLFSSSDYTTRVIRGGMARLQDHRQMLVAAEADVVVAARDLRMEAIASLRRAILILSLFAGISLVLVYYVGRSITRPLQRLARYAEAISAGDVHAERPNGRSGPAEVRVVDEAFRNVVENLRAIDAQSIALAAGHLDDPVLAEPLPGQLGRSLQASVQSLSQSIADREELQQRLAHEATHDGLTGVPNRSAAMFALESALARNRRRATNLAVLLVDLDDFKRTNDSLGHGNGDDLLRQTADRLRDLARTDDTIARLGGDEFLVVAEAVGSIHDAVAIGERIVEVLAQPFLIDGRSVVITASVGVALAVDGHVTGDDLVREADLAVYRAKAAGRGGVEVFDTTMRAEVSQRSEIESRLADAVHHDELMINYQPVVSAGSLQVCGFEALVRWRGPDGKLIPPDAFIPIAEASDLIIELDRWVLRHATAEIATWTGLGLPDHIHLAVNVSGRHLVDRSVVATVASALEDSGLDPRRLVLEITETVLLSDMPVACAHLEQIRALGVTVAIDDFGVGYTSLATLRNLPVDVLKIDRSLVAELHPDRGQSLVRLIIEAAHEFGMGVIAEGVETDEQRMLLDGLGCEQVQGWLVSPAVPAQQARELVTTLAG